MVNLVDAMNAAVLAHDPDARIVPYMLSGGTDAKAFATLAFGVSVRSAAATARTGLRGAVHGVDERVPVDALQFGARVLEHFLKKLLTRTTTDPHEKDHLPMAFPYNPYDSLPALPSFTLTSADITDGRPIKNAQVSGIMGAGGQDLSPQLSWSGFPEADPQLRRHRVRSGCADRRRASALAVANLPATVTDLPTGVGDGSSLPGDALTLRNDAGIRRYVGAAPPAATVITAISWWCTRWIQEKLDLAEDASRPSLGFNLLCTRSPARHPRHHTSKLARQRPAEPTGINTTT